MTQTILMRKSCKCGRKCLVVRPTFGTGLKPVCGYCKTYGLEESLRLKENFEKQFEK